MQPKHILKEYFGYENFRKGQVEIIDGIVSGRDVFCIMPTSGGKSLGYQIPALVMEGITLVISPLISLMKDQVDALREYGISATYLNSTLPGSEYKRRLEDIHNEAYKLVYIAPERLTSPDFLVIAMQCNIAFIAIDEAHCISQWGHDFRPDYREIPKFVSRLNKRPVLGAFTATATEQIKEDIKNILNLHVPLEIITGFDRPNLYFGVEKGINKKEYIAKYIKNHIDDSGIIYCATRKEVESLGDYLKEKGFAVSIYHAGLSSNERQLAQEGFIYDENNIMIATNAFGMGIDKSNVRFVIHHNMPKNMEAYYQEAGRAGRDGEDSDCILLFSPQDVVKQKYLINLNNMQPERESLAYKNLQNLVDYCHTHDCLRKRLIDYFGDGTEVGSSCKKCSNCLDYRDKVNITEETQKILSCVYRMKEGYGVVMVASVLKGSKDKKLLRLGFDRLSTYGIMHSYTRKEIQQIILFLIAEGYLALTEGKYPVVQLTAKSKDVLKGKEQIFKRGDVIRTNDQSHNEIHEELLKSLKEVRKQVAFEKNIPPYIVFSDTTLKEMSIFLPQGREEILKIKGVGNVKMDAYGELFISIIRDYVVKYQIESTINKETKPSLSQKPSVSNKTKTHMITYELLQQGLTIEKIANERKCTENTILNHLEKCMQEGMLIDCSNMIDEKIENQIKEVISKVGDEFLKPIKEALPENISYIDIKKIRLKNMITHYKK